MDEISIMTSCDENLLRYVTIQLQSIADVMKDKRICFYLFHGGIDPDKLDKLRKQCDEYENINFFDVAVKDEDDYAQLARYGGGWASAAYYPLCAHQYLPNDMDRIMYIDAGDTFFMNQPLDYYYTDFEDNALTVTIARFKIVNGGLLMYAENDIGTRNMIPDIARGLFNSGSYVINLEKMRELKYTTKDYIALAESLVRIKGDANKAYFGEQGILSIAFCGQLKGYNYPDVKDLWFMPNNFCLWYFDRIKEKPSYNPSVVHFAGAEKPWNMIYPIELDLLSNVKKERKVDMKTLLTGQAEYYYLWHEYAIKTEKLLSEIGVVWD